MTYRFPVVITQDKGGMYVAHVPQLKGCHTQAKTLSVLHRRLQEVMELCMEVAKEKKQIIPHEKFIALEHVEIDL